MAPRKTKQGASASGPRNSGKRSPRATASSRSRSSSAQSSSRKTPQTRTAARTSAGAANGTARSKSGGRKPSSAQRVSVGLGRWWLLPAAAVGVVALFVWTYYPVAAVQYRETRQRAELAAELKGLQARNARLRKEVERLKTPAGVEDYARSQLGLVKKGENVVVVVGGKDSEEPSKTARPVIDSDEPATEPIGPWTAFLDLVFGVR